MKKVSGTCEIEINKINGRVTFKCKNIKRSPTSQEIIDSIKNKGIKYNYK